jgi:hypothetical protein
MNTRWHRLPWFNERGRIVSRWALFPSDAEDPEEAYHESTFFVQVVPARVLGWLPWPNKWRVELVTFDPLRPYEKLLEFFSLSWSRWAAEQFMAMVQAQESKGGVRDETA